MPISDQEILKRKIDLLLDKVTLLEARLKAVQCSLEAKTERLEYLIVANGKGESLNYDIAIDDVDLLNRLMTSKMDD